MLNFAVTRSQLLVFAGSAVTASRPIKAQRPHDHSSSFRQMSPSKNFQRKTVMLSFLNAIELSKQPSAVLDLTNPTKLTPPAGDDKSLERGQTKSRPISDHPEHPANSKNASVYYSRTDNLVGLSTDQQAIKLADAMRSIGPGKVMLLETAGPRGGSYVKELAAALPKALEMIPPSERPEIRFFISDGRPSAALKPGDPHNPFADHLQSLNREKKDSGTAAYDQTNGARLVPNWGNDKVFEYFQAEVRETIELAKKLGIKSVLIDDHMGVPAKLMPQFKDTLGLKSDAEAQQIITGRYQQVLGMIRGAGLETGISSAGSPRESLQFGIDLVKLAPFADTIEIQAYREKLTSVQGMTADLYKSIQDNFDKFKNTKEIKLALVPAPNKIKLSENELIQYQKEINNFQKQVEKLYEQRGVTPPKVTTSLWAHQNFYK